ncbi:carboxypeptidase-like regulatory domain-containing protein [Hymenobacter sp. HD11105]
MTSRDKAAIVIALIAAVGSIIKLAVDPINKDVKTSQEQAQPTPKVPIAPSAVKEQPSLGAEKIILSGRVIDAESELPISGAHVSIESSGVPPYTYTDNKGVYRIAFDKNDEHASFKIRVDVQKYKVFNEYLSPNPQKVFQDIRLARTF